ncbi:MAG: methylenetetrahydrofolate reductase [Granulosicoccus sp.]
MNSVKLSFEFFPPRSDAQERRFWMTLGCLQTLDPIYMSMTWGALGTTSDVSLEVLKALSTDATVPVAAHLTCVGQTAESIRETIRQFDELGITRFVALRGDALRSQMPENGLEHASELVAILAEDGRRDISVAAYPEQHPESKDSKDDLHWLKHKLEAGAQRAITQFFFEPDTFLRFRDNAVRAGIDKPLIPGILPIHNIAKVQQFSQQCGASVPTSLIERFTGVSDAETRERYSVEHSVALCESLQREGVDEFHIYTLNQSSLSYQVSKALLGNTHKIHAAA